jgi:DNA (cytosine-5)-methyltransferase 1
MTLRSHPGVYEFFAGGGMARCGLGAGWRTLFANDFDPMKGAAYAANWDSEPLVVGDVYDLAPSDLPGRASLAWASSPCQDFSLAGKRQGLGGARSSAFYGFWRLMEALDDEGRAPDQIVIENVTGLFTSHGGADFTALCRALNSRGYQFGALEIDAAAFVPQSRPRVFVIASRLAAPALQAEGPDGLFHTRRVIAAHERLPAGLKSGWRWWSLPAPPRRNTALIDLLEPDEAVSWHSKDQTDRLVSLLGPVHVEKLEQALKSSARQVAALYRRTRPSETGRVQRAELRFDGLAGCLRTPGGGSSRQFLLVTECGKVRTRGLSPRESARLMGLPDSYKLPKTATAALHLAGDGVAVPVVRWLAEHLLTPLTRITPIPSKTDRSGRAMVPPEEAAINL